MSHLVLKAINEVQKAVVARGIAKDRKNQDQKFNFRGIDDALDAFGPLLAENGVLLSPSYSDLKIDARSTKSGGTTYNASVAGTFTFTHLEDGSTYTVGPFFGEANDGQDKAISKATSVAERNMFFLTFVVPHEPAIGGDPDGDTGENETVPDYADWINAVKECSSRDQLSGVKAELKKKFGDAVPRAVMGAYNAKLDTLKVKA